MSALNGSSAAHPEWFEQSGRWARTAEAHHASTGLLTVGMQPWIWSLGFH